MTYVIALPCVDVKDRACVEECPVDCIYEGDRTLYIHPDECVDCGACEPVCPVEAIYYEDDVPEEWSEYITANAEFFDDLGSPGGAAKMGPTGKDVPFIAALPPQGEELVHPAHPHVEENLRQAKAPESRTLGTGALPYPQHSNARYNDYARKNSRYLPVYNAAQGEPCVPTV